jgi:hypothetical protein
VTDTSTHTGRELVLMLAGKKPLAVFCAEAGALPWEELIPEEAFAPYVQSGFLLRRDLDISSTTSAGTSVALRYVLYALPGEEARLQVMLTLKRALHSGCGWNESCERVEGTLLGYSDDENDAHCARRFERNAP